MDTQPGTRIAVIGAAGSGKTTLARAIAERTGLALIDADRFAVRPGWQSVPRDEFAAQIRDAMDAAADGWVAEGMHDAIYEMAVDAADTVVLLDLPLRVVYPRVVARTFRRAATREVMSHGNVLRWRDVFGPRTMLYRGAVYYPRNSLKARTVFERSEARTRIRVFDQQQAEALVELFARAHGGQR